MSWNPFSCGKIELQAASAQEAEKEKGMGEDLQHKYPKENLPFSLWGVKEQIGQGLRCQGYLKCFLLTFSHFGHAALQFIELSNLHFSLDALQHPAGWYTHNRHVGVRGSHFTNRGGEFVQGQMLREKIKTQVSGVPGWFSR